MRKILLLFGLIMILSSFAVVISIESNEEDAYSLIDNPNVKIVIQHTSIYQYTNESGTFSYTIFEEGFEPGYECEVIDYNSTHIILKTKFSADKFNRDIPIKVLDTEKQSVYTTNVNIKEESDQKEYMLPFGFDKTIKIGEHSTYISLEYSSAQVCSNNWHATGTCAKTYDGDWSTIGYCSASGICSVYENFSNIVKPATNIRWYGKADAGRVNWPQYDCSFNVSVWNYTSNSWVKIYSGYNGTGQQILPNISINASDFIKNIGNNYSVVVNATLRYIVGQCGDSYYENNLSYEYTSNGTTYANETEGDNAILQGINSSEASSATNHVDQQIYVANTTNQSTGRFDYVAVYNSKRWAFNYVTTNDPTSNFTYMFNLTPTVYILEMTNKTTTEIIGIVSKYINDTYP
jgi:hypothetical protein